jgi:alcohol dehydrogenase (cytochrome c)
MRILCPALVLSHAAAAFLLPAQVRPDDLLKSPNHNWLTYAGDYRGHRHSPLTQITPANAGSLVPTWSAHLPGAKSLQATPIVHDGVMYVANTNEVFALDTRSGRIIWRFKDSRSKKQNVNRGAAILGDKIYLALDRKSGSVAWQKQYGRVEDGLFASAAPLAVKDKIIVGVGGGDSGMRGYVSAFHAETGQELWKLYTVPAKGEPGAESWGGYVEWGGGGTWLSGTYDPDLNLLYWTTGNPWPDFYGGDRKGDNLYTCSLLAIDLETGKMKWHFQFTPHDVHDWDAQSWPVLINTEINGRLRKAVLHPNRNGFLYALDRVTGEFLRATPMVDKLDWAKGIDAKGRPILVPGKDPTPSGNYICPGVRGAANWMAPTYSPQTGLLYVINLEQCDVFTSSAQTPEPKKNFAGGGANPKPSDPGQFFLRAWDPTTGKKVWEYPMTGPGTSWSGTVSTAGGVIFFGDDDGQLVALDAKTGRHLWHFLMGENLTAAPMVYAVDGKQFVAICSATAVYNFGLFEPKQSIAVPAVKIQ